MKKLFMAVLTCILVSFSALGLRARFDTCALLIADADMKTEDLMNKVTHKGVVSLAVGMHTMLLVVDDHMIVLSCSCL